MPESSAQAGTLRRELGLVDAVGIGFGAIIGAGIFVVIGVAAGVAGPSLIAALVIAAGAATANALSSAQLAARYPHAGGAYEYGYQVLHPLAGFAAGWLFLTSKIAAAGTVALGLSGYLEALVPAVSTRWAAVAAVALFTLLNCFGIRRSSRANLVMVSVSIGALLLFVAAGAGSVRQVNFRPFAPAGIPGVLEGAALLFFAYTGYARIATLAEEVREPARVIPQAIVITIGSAVAIYLAVAIVAVGAVGVDRMAGSDAPLHSVALAFPTPRLAGIVAVGGMTAMLGVILSQLLGLSRVVFAMARRGDLPRLLDRVHPEYGVPQRAVLFVGAAAAIVTASGTLRGIASAASFAILLYYGIANLAALRMRRADKRYPDIVPIVGLVSCAVLALSLPLPVVATGMLVLAAGFGVRVLVRRSG